MITDVTKLAVLTEDRPRETWVVTLVYGVRRRALKGTVARVRGLLSGTAGISDVAVHYGRGNLSVVVKVEAPDALTAIGDTRWVCDGVFHVAGLSVLAPVESHAVRVS